MDSRKLGDLLLLANGLVLILLVNILSSIYFSRFDLTEEKRYTIKDSTKELLANLEDEVFVEVFLEGDLNPGFTRFQKAIRETLQQFRVYSNNRLRFVFTNPLTAMSQQAQVEYIKELMKKGITPTDVVQEKDGETSAKRIFPGAMIYYDNLETSVMLLREESDIMRVRKSALTSDELINQSIEGLEYNLASVIYSLVNEDRKRIGLVRGHGELDSLEFASFNSTLLDLYDVFKVDLLRSKLNTYDALIVAKPKTQFSELEKYNMDQFIMNGGRAIFLLDKLEASMDSASSDNYFAFPYNLNLDDMLFKYGVRLNMDLMQDRNSGLYPVITGQMGERPQLQLMEWPFFPLINRYADHPVTRNLDAVMARFVSSMDTVKATGIRKTPMLFTSEFTRTMTAPVKVSVNDLRKSAETERFPESFLPVAYLLEGNFTSVYKNRFLPEGASQSTFQETGQASKIFVMADGDIARNDVNPRTSNPQQLGFDPFTGYTFANEEFLLNVVAYLIDDGLIQARNKQVKIRPLDKTRVTSEEFKWQLINLGAPLIMLVAFGLARNYIRRKKFASF